MDLSEETDETTKQVVSFRDLLLSHCRETANPPVNGFFPMTMISLNIQKRKAYGAHLLAIVMLDLRDSSANYTSNSDETIYFVDILLNQVQSTGIEDDERKEMALEG